MPRYFIDSSDGERDERDDVGLDLPDDETARRTALDALPDMAREVLPNGDQRTFAVHVRTADGSDLYRAEMILVGRWLNC